ncbi:MAG: alpha/beta hydrolase [Myxococcota bacterium]
MPFAEVGDLRFAHDTFGDRSDPPVVLIMGLGSQMLAWRTGFCRALADRGLFVVRFDNRDIGLSTRVVPKRTHPLWTLTLRQLGQRVDPPYSLVDMSNDVVGLMDALGIEAAHIVGASMGGMIAQLCAINHRARVLSLTSMMSTTGDRDLPGPEWRVRQWYFRPMAGKPEDQVNDLVSIARLVGSSTWFDELDIRTYFERVVARSADRTGVPRQLLAVLSARTRRGGLQRLSVPTLVLHGLDDTMLPPAHGVRTANTIPDATLQLIPALGHDLPRALWNDIASRIADHAHAAHPRVLRPSAWLEFSTKKTAESHASR